MAENTNKFSKDTTLDTLKKIYKYQNRLTIRFVFDNALRNPEITDLDSLKQFMASAHIDVDTSSDDDWSFVNHTFATPITMKLSELSSRFQYNVANAKKALASNSLDPIPDTRAQKSDSDSDTDNE